jgi:hypothetical protein
LNATEPPFACDAAEHALLFVCDSAGTRNTSRSTSALTATTPRVDESVPRCDRETHVDYATVNDRFFVNNVSLGVYAKIVQEESYRDAKLDTTNQTIRLRS